MDRAKAVRVLNRKNCLLIHRCQYPSPAANPNLWSGRRESNPRPTAWKAVTLPLSYSRAGPDLPSRSNLPNLELTERLELSTSPLPRECSTTELRQRILSNHTRLTKSHRERILPNITRNAKNPKRIRHRERYLPGSIVNLAPPASAVSAASATTMRPVPAGLKSTFLSRLDQKVVHRGGFEPP